MKYEYDVFISYSSRDRGVVEHLSKELCSKGFSVWLDEWEIQVGEQIIQKITEGLESSRYLAVWLSEYSVTSKWVEREWQSKYWDEVNSKLTVVLPLLGEKCEIPTLLKGKKYADFSKSFDEGLSKLLQAIEPNSSVMIEYCIKNLIEGSEAEVCAEKLGKIAIRSKDEEAIGGLWTAVQKTKKTIYVIEHCAYYVGRVMIESMDSKMEEIGFRILNDSTKSESEIIVDKFAYTAGAVALQADNKLLRMQLIDFIEKNSESEVDLLREKYSYTKERVKDLNNTIYNLKTK